MTEGMENRGTRERFLCVLDDPADQNTPSPMSGSQTLPLPALENEEWRDRGERRDMKRTFARFLWLWYNRTGSMQECAPWRCLESLDHQFLVLKLEKAS